MSTLLEDLDAEAAYTASVSPLYHALCRILRGELSDAGPLAILRKRIDILWQARTFNVRFHRPLMLLAVLHRLALAGDARLSRFYATCGGRYDGEYDKLRDTVVTILRERADEFLMLLAGQEVQTNEVSRGIAWMLPALCALHGHTAPMALFELGTSAGLNMIADRYGWHIVRSAHEWCCEGPLAMPVSLDATGVETSAFEDLPRLSSRITVRQGCDLNVPDLCDGRQRDVLRALIWGDDVARLKRFDIAENLHKHALAVGDVVLKQQSARDFVATLPARVRETGLPAGSVVMIFNSVVTCYFSTDEYGALTRAVADSFAQLSDYRCLWVEHEQRRRDIDAEADWPEAEAYIKIHRLDGVGGLTRSAFAATQMHPKRIQLW